MNGNSMRTTNKTLNRGLVTPTQGFATIAYHALVVINERDGGRTVQQTLDPDKPDKFRRPLLLRGTLVSYHVALDERLRHTFGWKVSHGDGVHSFSVQFDLSYRVLRDSPHLLVLRLEDDPLGSIEDEIKRILSAPLRALDWSVIQDHANVTPFTVPAKSIDDGGDLVVNMERIRIYGRSFGIDVRQIGVTRYLETVDVEVRRSELEIAKKAKLRDHTIQGIYDQQREDEARLVVEHKLATSAALHNARTNSAKIIEEYAAGTRDAIRGITSSAKSISEIASQLRQVKDVAEIAQRMVPGFADGSEGGVKWVPLLPSDKTSPMLGSGAPPTAFEGPARNVEDVMARAYEVAAALPVNEAEQRQFLAAVLRLQAARMVEADGGELEKHRSELQELHRVHAQDMREEHSRFVAELVRVRPPTR
jgi:hypothetical protein